MIGTTVSHYKILEKLGEGGMGVVYKARDTKLDRTVALKFLPAHLSASEQDKARFTQEAKAASALSHPNVCTIHDIRESDGRMFIVMEFVDGQTLRDRRGQIGFKQAVEIGIQVADGLSAAHEKGIVHRDIKPENIMLRKDGIVQIMDFGLAKLRGSVTRLTKEGSTVGTAGYMSPEQVQGLDADHRSDIFSLGVLLYELFTGQLPFKGVHETALAYEIVHVDAPPMSSVMPEIDPSLDSIVLECLEKDPNERTQSVKQLSIDLKRFKRESSRSRVSRITPARPSTAAPQPGAVPPPPDRRSRPVAWYAATGIMAVAILFLLFNPWRREDAASRPVMRFTIDLPEDQQLWAAVGGIAISPDAGTVAYVARIPNSRQIFLRKMDQPNSEPIPGTENSGEPVFSPDGQWIAYNAQQKIFKVPVSGGAPEALCPTQGATRGITWSFDNMIYYGQVSGGIARVSAAGGTPEAVTTPDSAAGEISHRFPNILPDGKTVVYTVKQNNITSFDEAVIVAQRLGTGERKVLVRGGTSARYAASGHLVYVRNSAILAAPFDPDRVELKGPPMAIEQRVWMFKGSGQALMEISRNGVLVFAPSLSSTFGDLSFAWMDRKGTVSPLFDTLRQFARPGLSPDGQKIATTINAANNDIWTYHMQRGVLTRLTFGEGNNDYPVWTPDGRNIVYAAEKGRAPNLFRKPWDGSGAEERLTTSPSAQSSISCSPDGKYVSYNENGDIWILPLDSAGGGRVPWPFLKTPANELDGRFSPVGRWMVYGSDESGKNEVYVTGFPKREGKWQISNGGGGGAFWARDGRSLYYVNGTSLMVAGVQAAATFDYSVPRKLCDVPPLVSVQDVSPDGSRFLALVSQTKQLSLPQMQFVLEWFDKVRGAFSGNKN